MRLRLAVEQLKCIANRLEYIQEFGFGDINKIGNTNKNFPLMWVTPTEAGMDGTRSYIKMDILIMDLERSDDDNLINVFSETLSASGDVIALLSDNDNDNVLIDTENVVLEPFSARFNDNVAGWLMTVVFNEESLLNVCNLPLNEE